jgi:ATP-dependent RNA helicase DeaD
MKLLNEALAERGYHTLTSVQQAVIAPELENKDLVVSAETGSGKTVGFGLAIAPKLLGENKAFDNPGSPLALIIAPTRELAMQVKQELTWLYEKVGAKIVSCVGGMDMREERRSLSKGAHIVVATPGRLRDHIMRKSLLTKQINTVVLDEADEMLDLGFQDDLEFILEKTPTNRRTLMFSATIPDAIIKLTKTYQVDAKRLKITNENSQHSDIDYRVISVAKHDTENAIINLLRYHEAKSSLVFCNTRAMVNRLSTRFSNRGFSVVALSGELSQNERTQALQSMRDGRAKVCIATDVAARGIDLPSLELVIHADLPSNYETLLHRSGRTGRAGRKGVSALIISKRTQQKAQRLLKLAKIKASFQNAPSVKMILEKDYERMVNDPIWEDELGSDQIKKAKLLLDKYDPDKIAAAYINLYNSQKSAPEDLTPLNETLSSGRKTFGRSVWFSIEGGSNRDVQAKRLLPMLSKLGNVRREEIGKIIVENDISYFELRHSSLDKFINAMGHPMRTYENAEVKQIDNLPNDVSLKKMKIKNTKKFKSVGNTKFSESNFKKDSLPKSNDFEEFGLMSDSEYLPAKNKKKDKVKKADSKQKTKGIKTPIGKPNSKKNKARRAAKLKESSSKR